jgi:hypothetical protein
MQPLRTSTSRHYKQLKWLEHQIAIFSSVLYDPILAGAPFSLPDRWLPDRRGRVHVLRFLTVAFLRTRQAPEADMRILLSVLLATAVVAGAAFEAAYAQNTENSGLTGRKGKGQNAAESQADKQKKTKAIDDAYKSAVTRIPDPKEKYDPWKNAR